MRKITLLTFSVLFLTITLMNNQVNANNNYSINNIEFNDIEFEFFISPNPTKDSIIVKFKTKTTANLLIHDGIGNEVLNNSINDELEKEISLQDINEGIYFISVKTDLKTEIKRFIKY